MFAYTKLKSLSKESTTLIPKSHPLTEKQIDDWLHGKRQQRRSRSVRIHSWLLSVISTAVLSQCKGTTFPQGKEDCVVSLRDNLSQLQTFKI